MFFIIIILIGMIVGYMLFNYYKKITQKYHGPNSNIVKKTIHENNGKCFIFEPHVYMCPIF